MTNFAADGQVGLSNENLKSSGPRASSLCLPVTQLIRSFSHAMLFLMHIPLSFSIPAFPIYLFIFLWQHGQFLNRQFHEYAKLYIIDFERDEMRTRNGVLRILSLVDFFLRSPQFQPMIQYSWYSSGIGELEQPDFKTTKEKGDLLWFRQREV